MKGHRAEVAEDGEGAYEYESSSSKRSIPKKQKNGFSSGVLLVLVFVIIIDIVVMFPELYFGKLLSWSCNMFFWFGGFI